jgi:hypothetical protein
MLLVACPLPVYQRNESQRGGGVGESRNANSLCLVDKSSVCTANSVRVRSNSHNQNDMGGLAQVMYSKPVWRNFKSPLLLDLTHRRNYHHAHFISNSYLTLPNNPSLDSNDLNATLTLLLNEARIPASKLPSILSQAPQILQIPPDILQSKLQTYLRGFNGKQSHLSKAIVSHPTILTDEFTNRLSDNIDHLTAIGFSRSQAGRIVITAPQIFPYNQKPLDILQFFYRHGGGIDLSSASPKIFAFFTSYPSCLIPDGNQNLIDIIRTMQMYGFPPQKALDIIAKYPKIIKNGQTGTEISVILEIFLSFAFSQTQLSDLIAKQPSILYMDPFRLKWTLGLLAAFEVPPSKVVNYPRLFIHSPFDVVGPRLAYLKNYRPKFLKKVKLATVLCRSDMEFCEKYVSHPAEEYFVFKERWAAQMGRKEGAKRDRMVKEMLVQEMATELWK